MLQKIYSFVPKGQTQPQHGTGWCFCDLGRVSEVNEKGQKILSNIKKSPSVMLDDKDIETNMKFFAR
jgi:hypothetical protein